MVNNKLVASLLACLTIVHGIPTPFPHGETLVYNYYGDVKAGIIEPAPYASQYAISGQLNIKHDTSDPSLDNAYYAVLTNVKTGLHNGVAAHFQTTRVNMTLPEGAKAIELPFLMVYNKLGQLDGVKLLETDAAWSKNMKMAIASMLQLDLVNLQLDQPVKTRAFMAKEKTVHGDCWTSYDVHPNDPVGANKISSLTVFKFSSPRNCSNYNVHSYNHVETERCDLPPEAPVNMAARRVFQVDNQGENILIKSLIAHGGANYFPWKGRSEAHYVLNNASFVLEKKVPSSELQLPEAAFQNVNLTSDLSFLRPTTHYAEYAGLDLTQGRHEANQDSLVSKVKKMLGEAEIYLEENHLKTDEPDFKHGQTINRILYYMGFLEFQSYEKVFIAIQDTPTPRDVVIKNLFIDIVAQVGTPASFLFSTNLIKNRKITDYMRIVRVLALLPSTVRVPSKDFCDEMQKLVEDKSLNLVIRKAAILSLSSLVYKTFKDEPKPEENPIVNNYLRQFIEDVMVNPKYEMKAVAIMAIKNIQVGNIHKLLEPIIRGDVEVSENPVNIRLLAIWAVKKAVANDYNVAHDLLWPVMADYKAPLKIRIAAYDILIRQAPTMTNILHIYWFMVYEKNEHLYNYHHTTIKGLANTVDPCQGHLRELATKIMRYTRIHSPVPYKLSSSYMFDTMDNVYGHGEKLEISYTLNEETGMVEVIHLQHVTIEGRRPVTDFEVYLNLEGIDVNTLLEVLGIAVKSNEITDQQVIDLLKKVASDMPQINKDFQIDMVTIKHGEVIGSHHLTQNHVLVIADVIERLLRRPQLLFPLTRVYTTYERLYAKQIVSEMGLPVLLETRVPKVDAFKLNVQYNDSTKTVIVELDARMWRHGDYSMSIYNPFMDVWHAIRRSTSLDVVTPLTVHFSYNLATNSLVVKLPRLPVTKYSTAGVRTHAKDITTVTEDEHNSLAEACSTCLHHEVVSKGLTAKKNYNEKMDSQDTGLEYSASIFDCENEISPILFRKESFRAWVERKNSWTDIIVHGFFAYRQQLKNRLLSPQMGSCGTLLRVQPSNLYPTSHVDLALRMSYEDFDHSPTTTRLHTFNGKKVNIRGTINAYSATTNESARKWDFFINGEISSGRQENSVNVRMTRTTPGETNLKICIDAQKVYPPERYETNSKISFSMGHTDMDMCVQNETLIVATLKAELTDEQRKMYSSAIAKGACEQDRKNPLYKNSNDPPETISCIDETIKYATLRKYDLKIVHENVPTQMVLKAQTFENIIRSMALPQVTFNDAYSDPGVIHIAAAFPTVRKTVNISLATPFYSYDVTDVEINIDDYPPRHLGFGPDIEKHLWMFPLDNTAHTFDFLIGYTDGDTKICSLYPGITTTSDGGEISYVIPSDWTLISGDYDQKYFAVFVKNVDNKLGLKIYSGNHTIEMNGAQIKIDNEMFNDVEKGTFVPSKEYQHWTFKITKENEDVFIQLKNPELGILYTENVISLDIDRGLQGTVAGLCGSMNGKHTKIIPKVYTLVKA